VRRIDVRALALHIEHMETRKCVMVTSIQHYIDGRKVSGHQGRTSPVFNPATGEQTGALPIANAADVADAVAAANKAAPGWAAKTPLRRARVLNRFLRIQCADGTRPAIDQRH
jgi:delta 1-pyrroline-5-carboxylate dehydrogenase